MKYQHISWNLEINCEDLTDLVFEEIAKRVENGETSGEFALDNTEYDYFDTLKDDLETLLGRDVDCDYNDIGELEELYEIAQRNEDDEIAHIISELLQQFN